MLINFFSLYLSRYFAILLRNDKIKRLRKGIYLNLDKEEIGLQNFQESKLHSNQSYINRSNSYINCD